MTWEHKSSTWQKISSQLSAQAHMLTILPCFSICCAVFSPSTECLGSALTLCNKHWILLNASCLDWHIINFDNSSSLFKTQNVFFQVWFSSGCIRRLPWDQRGDASRSTREIPSSYHALTVDTSRHQWCALDPVLSPVQSPLFETGMWCGKGCVGAGKGRGER